jgi:2-keto-4-pentenoate hydratase/2-oxohepta-3-ene-1,7-dioic acid hydratase in catechol pathway
MKVAVRLSQGGPRLCLEHNETCYDVHRVCGLLQLNNRERLLDLLESDKSWSHNLFRIAGLWDVLQQLDTELKAVPEMPEGCKITGSSPYLPPLSRPPLVFGLAGNCPMTWRAKSIPTPNYPVGYVRPWSSISAHEGRVVLKREVTSFRCAVELGVVIGRRARNVNRECAMDYVAAYTIVNDMISNHWKDYAAQANTETEPSFHELLVTSYYGRGSDGFCPIGPALVSKDEIADPYDLLMWSRKDGVTIDRSHTNAMVVGIEAAIEYLSGLFPLEPGTLIHMGTMGIDGITLAADKHLGPDSSVELEIEKLGVLRTFFDDRRGNENALA